MSKINAIRLINVSYNNNAIKVNDETFSFGGMNTLMSLRNGGGKSVLTQLVTALFVHKNFMHAGKRRFESYFTSSKPSFILVEWKLDGFGGYCLTGMMVRKNQAADTDELERIQFICEYGEPCEWDIRHIPVVEQTKKETKLKGFAACRTLFEELKKSRDIKFFSYDMNNYSQARQYFNKLEENRIYYKEWENIIHEINKEESGLSRLFEDCGSERALVEKWFLDSIEKKLDRDKSRMGEFSDISGKYIASYRDSRSKIERRDTILKFLDDMSAVSVLSLKYSEAADNVSAQREKIGGTIFLLEGLEKEAKDACALLEEKINLCAEKLLRIKYEKLSSEYYVILDDKDAHARAKSILEAEKDSLERECDSISNSLNKIECVHKAGICEMFEKPLIRVNEKIAALEKSDGEKEPERKRIGGLLKTYYTETLSEAQNQKSTNEAELSQIKEKVKTLKSELESLSLMHDDILENQAKCNAAIEFFDREENRFNTEFGEKFSRNILGEYEPGFIEITKENFEKAKSELKRAHTENLRLNDDMENEEKALLRKSEDAQREKADSEKRFEGLEREKKALDEQKNERISIMKYLDLTDGDLWNKEKILESADLKISDCERLRRQLEKEENRLQNEINVLKSGEYLDVPKEFTDMLEAIGINYVYGSKWLGNNANTPKQNKALIREQPFLPYSLIVSEKDALKLSSHSDRVYTNAPIPILIREKLEEGCVCEESPFVSFGNLNFYVSFNEELLDPESLNELINKKLSEIEKVRERTKIQSGEHRDYINRKNIIERQSLSYETEKKLLESIAKEQELAEKAQLSLQEIHARRDALIDSKNKLSALLIKEENELSFFKRRIEGFKVFSDEYAKYIDNLKQKKRLADEMNELEEKTKLTNTRLQKNLDKEKSFENALNVLEQSIAGLTERASRYEKYEGLLLDGDINITELEERYEAITVSISEELSALERERDEALKNYDRSKKELDEYMRKHSFVSDDLKDIKYDLREVNHLEELLADALKRFKEKEALFNQENRMVSDLMTREEFKLNEIKNECGENEPLAREELTGTDFDDQAAKVSNERREHEKELEAKKDRKTIYEQNLTALSEYDEFKNEKEIAESKTLSLMDAEELRKFTGLLRRDLTSFTAALAKAKEACLSTLHSYKAVDDYKEDFYQKPLDAMISTADDNALFAEQLETVCASFSTQLEKLEVDISVIDKEKERISLLLKDYVMAVHDNLGKIDGNSGINVGDKSIKMLKITVPDWEENKELYERRISAFLDEITLASMKSFDENKNPADYLAGMMTTRNLYDKVVGTGNVNIKLYKIEEQRQIQISWAEVSKNSGGEGFLSAFVILSSLLYYMRRDESDIFSDKNEGKVLIMDNPFGQTYSPHLLKPLVELAKKNNTQLICLSGIGGDSIYSRFDNIYVLNLVPSELYAGTSYLHGEHITGEEEETIISSHIEVYEQESLLF